MFEEHLQIVNTEECEVIDVYKEKNGSLFILIGIMDPDDPVDTYEKLELTLTKRQGLELFNWLKQIYKKEKNEEN